MTQSSLDQYINTFIGKPLVLTEDFRHPLPPDTERVSSTSSDTEYYDNDDNPNNVVKVNDIIDHWLAYQEPFRVGNIIDIVKKGSTYYSIIEVTDEFTKTAFKNNELPLFVSPAIAQLDPFESADNISKWTGIHLAIVSNPAYTIKKALISGQCHDEQNKCLLQLRNASVEQNRKDKKLDCGFCRQQALQRYATKTRNELGSLHWASNYDDFMNSSVVTLTPQIKTLTAENNNNNNKPATTNYEANRQTNDNPDDNSTEQHPTTDTSNEQPAGVEQTRENNKKQTETKVITNETNEVAKTADLDQCVQILAQIGVQDQQQAQQVCQMLAQSFTNSYNTPNAGKSMGPPQSGQMGSVDELQKQISKHVATIEKLQDDLKSYKKNDKTDLQRIAELEEQVKVLNNTIKEKELDNYLVSKIADEDLRNKKIKRFADLGLSVEDVKDIYEPQVKEVKKTASVEEVVTPSSGKVKLQTASTNESEDQEQTSTNDSNSNKIREANNRIVSSFRAKPGVY